MFNPPSQLLYSCVLRLLPLSLLLSMSSAQYKSIVHVGGRKISCQLTPSVTVGRADNRKQSVVPWFCRLEVSETIRTIEQAEGMLLLPGTVLCMES